MVPARASGSTYDSMTPKKTTLLTVCNVFIHILFDKPSLNNDSNNQRCGTTVNSCFPQVFLKVNVQNNLGVQPHEYYGVALPDLKIGYPIFGSGSVTLDFNSSINTF